MALDETRLREFVADVGKALAPILPAGFQVWEDDGQLVVSSRSGTDFLPLGLNIDINVREGVPLEDATRLSMLSTLNVLQDIVTVILTVPWPNAPGGGPYDFAYPRVEIRQNRLSFWFGDEHPHGAIPNVPLPSLP